MRARIVARDMQVMPKETKPDFVVADRLVDYTHFNQPPFSTPVSARPSVNGKDTATVGTQ